MPTTAKGWIIKSWTICWIGVGKKCTFDIARSFRPTYLAISFLIIQSVYSIDWAYYLRSSPSPAFSALLFGFFYCYAFWNSIFSFIRPYKTFSYAFFRHCGIYVCLFWFCLILLTLNTEKNLENWIIDSRDIGVYPHGQFFRSWHTLLNLF